MDSQRHLSNGHCQTSHAANKSSTITNEKFPYLARPVLYRPDADVIQPQNLPVLLDPNRFDAVVQVEDIKKETFCGVRVDQQVSFGTILFA